jgi:glycerol-3-phosphate dehydrogenase
MNPPLDRSEQIARLTREHFDVAIMGGGINGAAIARDAALRGMRVALIDAADFAGATSSRSSKLIHGGLRYLAQGRIRLVREALAERERLRIRTAPHLVRPLEFLFPTYRGIRPGTLELGAGLSLYDFFARLSPADRHRWLDREALLAQIPRLHQNALKGGFVYTDAWADDARLTIENVLDAAMHGAAVANYVALVEFGKSSERLTAAGLRDRLSGTEFELHASVFVNAAGAWADAVRRLDEPDAEAAIRLSKGVHLVFDKAELPLACAIVIPGRADRRIVFIMPHGESVIIGTTDSDYFGDPAQVKVEPRDVHYLLDFIRPFIVAPPPATTLASSYAGLRALASKKPGGQPSSLSREEVMLVSRRGLVTVAGGKLTTHRAIAEKVTDFVAESLGGRRKGSPTRMAPLPGARPLGIDYSLPSIPAKTWRLLCERYGSRAALVGKIIAEQPDLASPLVENVPAIGAEVIFALRYEMAAKLADFIIRRASLGWRAPRYLKAATHRAAELMAEEMSWDTHRLAQEIADVEATVAS